MIVGLARNARRVMSHRRSTPSLTPKGAVATAGSAWPPDVSAAWGAGLAAANAQHGRRGLQAR